MRRAWVSGLLLVSSCLETDYEPQFGRLVAQGEHIEIWASPGVEVCGGNVEYMDAFVEALRAEVGPYSEYEDVHRYYALNDKDWKAFDDAVDCRGEACTTASRTIYARGFTPSTHEIVHAELFSDGHRFFEEGVAVHYGEVVPGNPDDYDVVDGLSETWVVPEAYTRAGHFASFVIDHYGIEAFLQAKDATHYGDSFEAVSQALAAATGEPIEALLDDYAEVASKCDPPGYQAMLVECAQTPTPWERQEWGSLSIEWDIEFGCADGNVTGPYGGYTSVTRSFELDEPAQIYIRVIGEDTKVVVSRCDGSCSESQGLAQPRSDTFELFTQSHADLLALLPGRYTVRIAQPIELGPSRVRLYLILWSD